MNKLLLEGEYAEIIIQLLKPPYNIDSVVKIIFMAFCIKNETRPSYGNKKIDFADVFFSNINIKLFSHTNELKCIFEIINKLKKSGWIKTDKEKIIIIKSLDKFECNNCFLTKYVGKIQNPIKELNKLDNKAFVEEILRYV